MCETRALVPLLDEEGFDLKSDLFYPERQRQLLHYIISRMSTEDVAQALIVGIEGLIPESEVQQILAVQRRM